VRNNVPDASNTAMTDFSADHMYARPRASRDGTERSVRSTASSAFPNEATFDNVIVHCGQLGFALTRCEACASPSAASAHASATTANPTGAEDDTMCAKICGVV
jgi:hypothetical protein